MLIYVPIVIVRPEAVYCCLTRTTLFTKLFTCYMFMLYAGKSASGQAVCSGEHAEDGWSHCPILFTSYATSPDGSSGIHSVHLMHKNLPLHNVCVQDGSGGTLEVIVQYQALLDDREQMILPDSHKGKTHVTLAVEVRRATGLKDAALLVAQRQPVPLGFAAEVGTNNYARVSFSDFLEKVSC